MDYEVKDVREKISEYAKKILWTTLPVSICETKSLSTFRRHLKTSYFHSARPLSAAHLA